MTLVHVRVVSCGDRHALRIALCTVVVLFVSALHVCAAQAHAVRSHSSNTPTARAADTYVVKTVCKYLELPVPAAARKLGKFLFEEEIPVLATALVASVSAHLICKPAVKKLRQVITTMVAQRPALKPQVGPFAFGLTVVGSPWNATYNHFVLSWTPLDPTGYATSHSVWYQYDNSGRWFQFPKSGLVPRVAKGHTVQFALRIEDNHGLLSPWVYSVNFNDY